MVRNIPAIIPARGGSKGIPLKNIRMLGDKPLIAWTIEAAKNSKYIRDVIVSTDDQQIADVSKQYGALVPFYRPAELASDSALATDVYFYTIERLIGEFKWKIEDFIILQPTSPLRTHRDIDNAIEHFYKTGAESLVSVTDAPYPIHWMKKVNSAGYIEDFLPLKQDIIANRQDFEKTFIPNGAISILKFSLFQKHKKYYYPQTVPYFMERKSSVDIDDEIDFTLAQLLLKDIYGQR